MQLAFGSGATWVVPTTTVRTPSRFRILQSASADFSRRSVPLIGLNQLPVAVAVSTMTVKLQADYAQLDGRLINDNFLGGTSTAGAIVPVYDEGPSTIPGTPFQITVTNGANFKTDLGVRFSGSNSNVPFTQVSTSTTPSTGQYTVASTTGVYTFSSLETGSVKFSYLYNSASLGQTLTMSNQAMGVSVTFQTVLTTQYNSLYSVWTFNACVATDISIKTELENWAKPNFKAEAYADGNDVLGTVAFAEIN